jgi:hypothetical protein
VTSGEIALDPKASGNELETARRVSKDFLEEI